MIKLKIFYTLKLLDLSVFLSLTSTSPQITHLTINGTLCRDHDTSWLGRVYASCQTPACLSPRYNSKLLLYWLQNLQPSFFIVTLKYRHFLIIFVIARTLTFEMKFEPWFEIASQSEYLKKFYQTDNISSLLSVSKNKGVHFWRVMSKFFKSEYWGFFQKVLKNC